MSRFPVHTIESAPDTARETLSSLRRQFGAIPNLAAAMANAPSLLKGFVALRNVFYNESSFTPLEIQVLALSNAFENECRYCMALHSTLALKEGLSAGSLAELRAGRAPHEMRLAALSDFSRKLVRQRGHVTGDDLATFLAAGFTDAQVLEVILGAAVSLLPNYAHQVTGAPLDAAFMAQSWALDREAVGAPVA